MTERFTSADPILSANLYASGLLDSALRHAVLPFQAQLTAGASGARNALWFVRYSRRGEHLKLRLHADPAQRQEWARLLEQRVEAWRRDLPPAQAQTRVCRSDVPVVDPEDEASEPAADRSLTWTTYRRSYVSLGGAPWLEDEVFVGLAYECLSAGSELALTALRAGQLESASGRQKALIKGLLAGVAALGPGAVQPRAEYVRHHRDVLLRFLTDESSKERRLLGRFDEQIARSAAVERLGPLVRNAWYGGDDKVLDARWPAALEALGAYALTFAGRPEYQLSRFTTNPAFSPAFKVFHGLANQLGLTWAEEAYVHQLLLAAGATTARDVEVGA